MIDLLGNAAEELGALRRITLWADDGSVPDIGSTDQWTFTFDSGGFSVSVNPDDDTVILATSAENMSGSTELTASREWSQILGCHVRWCWQLKNQRGYLDGFQIELGRPGESWCFQLIAEGSSLKFYSLSESATLKNLLAK